MFEHVEGPFWVAASHLEVELDLEKNVNNVSHSNQSFIVQSIESMFQSRLKV